MAPRGTSRSQTTQPGRALRNAPNLTSRVTRGGIQKRRGGSVRTDSDGDLDMDSARRTGGKSFSDSSQAPRGSRGTRGTARGASRAAQVVARHLNGGAAPLSSRVATITDRRSNRVTTGLTWLQVRGLKESKAANNEGGGLRDLLSFLERKASPKDNSRKVTIRKSHMAGDVVYVGATAEDAEEIVKLNTFIFAGASLDIKLESNDPTASKNAADSANAQDLKTKLQAVLSTRYDGDRKLLSLNQLAQDPTLVQLGSFAFKERAERTFQALMKVCDDLFKTRKEKQDAIQSITLADNNIDDVVQVDSVANTFPDLKHLDLSGNAIGSAAGMMRWKNKFRHLETLLLARNPWLALDSNYASAVMALFPRLQFLDNIQVRTPEQVAQEAAARLPKPLPQHGPDFRDVGGIGEGFLLEFFTMFDTDRQGLLAKFYDDASHFSLSVDTLSVRAPNAPPAIPWGAYIKFSRNLKKITTDNGRHQRLFRGRQVILDLWNSLPATKHPDIKTETSKYVMDCHSLAGLGDPTKQAQRGVDGMVLAIHGEFQEMDKDGKIGQRSFSRTIVLGPGLPGGNSIRVVSDMLCLRAANPLPNIFEQPQQQQPPQVPQQPAIPIQQGQPSGHDLMIIQLSKETGMTVEYSRMCLEQAAWNYEQAKELYEKTKLTLPADAWAIAPVS